MSENENILEQIEKAEMQQLQKKIEQEQVEEEMRRIEERELEMAREMSKKVKKDPSMDRPYWFQGLLNQGYT